MNLNKENIIPVAFSTFAIQCNTHYTMIVDSFERHFNLVRSYCVEYQHFCSLKTHMTKYKLYAGKNLFAMRSVTVHVILPHTTKTPKRRFSSDKKYTLRTETDLRYV